MIKSELVTRLTARNPHLYQREVEAVVNTFFEEISDAMKERNRVELRGFGAFSVRVRGARTGRNPRTGASVEVPEKAAPFFRAGKEMRDRINAHEAAEPQARRGGRGKAVRDTRRRTAPMKSAAE